ncbi:MAG: undecaprenyl-diphosphate phosphatase [bacterium]
MPLLQLIILALIQGLTEFIPVSSSAHLILVPLAIDGFEDQGPLIDLAAHLGSLGAVMIYFRSDVTRLVLGGIDVLRWRDSQERQLFLYLSVATIPLVIGGAFLYFFDLIDLLRQPMVLGGASIGFGLLLWAADRRPEPQTAPQWNWKSVMTTGVAQACALIPGASRSGVTITAARFLGFSRHEAARFSMLLAIPAILILGTAASLDLAKGTSEASLSDGAIVAVLSFLSALAAIHIFLEMTKKLSFLPFVIYRVVLGVILIAIAII